MKYYFSQADRRFQLPAAWRQPPRNIDFPPDDNVDNGPPAQTQQNLTQAMQDDPAIDDPVNDDPADDDLQMMNGMQWGKF